MLKISKAHCFLLIFCLQANLAKIEWSPSDQKQNDEIFVRLRDLTFIFVKMIYRNVIILPAEVDYELITNEDCTSKCAL